MVGNLVRRAATIASSDLEVREAIALLCLRLCPCYGSILRLVQAHPLLSEEDLAGLLSLKRKSVHSLLSALHKMGSRHPISTSVGKRWHLCERGLRLLAAANHLHLRAFAVTSQAEEEGSHLHQRGEAWLLSHIQHTVGVYGFFASLAQVGKQQPGQELCWWETGAGCERRYRVGDQWHNLRPAALAEYRVGARRLRFWLEWDRGTMNARDLTVKFASYAHYLASRAWASEGAKPPRLLCVAPELAQERRMQRVAQASLTSTSGPILWTTTAELLHEHGPLASIWSPGIPAPGQAASAFNMRSVFETIIGNWGR